MTSPTVPDAGPESTLPELPFPIGSIEELVRALLKSLRAHQLYLPNNPIYKGALDTVRAAFAPVWAQTEDFTFSFTETEIRWFGRPVLEEPSKSSDSLPWLFFKDGVREITIQQGFEQDELVKLLDILQRVRKAAPDEDDLLTLLWEADFLNLKYRYVDLGLEPAPNLEDGADEAPAVSPEDVRSAIAEPEAQESRAGVVNLSDFDATLYFLDEKEIEYLQGEIAREYREDLRQNVAAILFDIYERQVDTAIRAEICDLLEALMLYLLAGGHFRTVAYVLREAQVAVQRGESVTPEQRERLSQLPSRLSMPEPLGQLLQSLDSAPELPPAEEMTELFEQLRPGALGTVFSWLSRLDNPRLRPLLEQAAGRLASANTGELVKLVLSTDSVVALEAVRRSGALKTQAAVAPISKLMETTAELRAPCVQALSEIGSPGALQALERWVADGDRDTRVAAVRALASRSYRPVLARVEAAVKGKPLREADLTEKVAFFEAYGSLAGDAGVSYLDSVLNGKGFLGRREEPEIRACAAMALGRISTPSAQESLRKASGEKDVVVRNAVNKALRGGA